MAPTDGGTTTRSMRVCICPSGCPLSSCVGVARGSPRVLFQVNLHQIPGEIGRQGLGLHGLISAVEGFVQRVQLIGGHAGYRLFDDVSRLSNESLGSRRPVG